MASAMASSSVPKRWAASTGPKISSRISAPWEPAQSKMVGSMYQPPLSARTWRPPTRSRAPSAWPAAMRAMTERVCRSSTIAPARWPGQRIARRHGGRVARDLSMKAS